MEKTYKVEFGNIFDYIADALVVTASPEVPKYKKGDDYCLEAKVYNQVGNKELTDARNNIGEIIPGEAKETGAFALSNHYKYLIHTTCFLANTYDSWETLERCYYNSLLLADQLKCKSIVLPLLATGVWEFPKREAFSVADTMIRTYIDKNMSKLKVTLVLTRADYNDLGLAATWDYKTSIAELEESLKGKDEDEIKRNAEINEIASMYAYQLQLKKRLIMESEEVLKNHRKEVYFDFQELVVLKMKELGYTYQSLSYAIQQDEKKIRRTIKKESTPKTDEILLRIGYQLEFDIYQINRTLEEYHFPILKGENLDEIHAMYYFSFLHGIFDKDYIVDVIEAREEKDD